MPTYGSEKTLDMVRGALASTARKGVRDAKNSIKRRHRQRVRQDLGVLARRGLSSLAIEAYEESGVDYERYPDHVIAYEVRDRRNHDSLSALWRWGEHVVSDVRPLDRATKLRSRLPDSVAGRHARQHLETHDAIRVLHPNDWRYRGYSYDYEALDPYWTYYEMTERLVGVLAKKGEHKRFNQYLKCWGNDPFLALEEQPDRLFLGHHDIEPFIDDTFGRRGHHWFSLRSLVVRYFDLSTREVTAISRWVVLKQEL